jgi:hypothetical protein
MPPLQHNEHMHLTSGLGARPFEYGWACTQANPR